MTDQKDDKLNDGNVKQKSSMPFLEHLEEFRWCLIKIVLSVIVGAFIAYSFKQFIFDFITQPLGDVELFNTTMTGSFYAYIKISLITGFLVALPYIFYQIWSFIAPGLYKKEKFTIIPLVLVSTILFLIGTVFCFKIVLPISLAFLIGFAEGQIENIITVGSYISFIGLLIMAFGFAFQMPLLSYFLGKIGFVNAKMLGKGRRYAVVGILIIGALITPPDVFTQLLLAVPLYFLYEVSIIVVKLTQKDTK